MRLLLQRLFKIVWQAVFGLLDLGGYDEPSDQEITDAQVSRRRAIAEVGANPTDRLLAQALLRSTELPPGLREAWRAWTPLDPATPIVTSVRQSLTTRSRFKRNPSSQMILDLRRYASEDEAAAAISRPPDRVLADGGRMRRRSGASGDETQMYEWTRREGAEIVDRVIELRLQRETAVAVLLAQANRPPTDWDRQLRELMRLVGSRLR